MATDVMEDYLEEYMEVVTAYKCKFCDVTCTSPQEMGHHVRSTHIQQRREVEGGQQQAINVSRCDNVNMAITPADTQQLQHITIETLQPTTKPNIAADRLQLSTKSTGNLTNIMPDNSVGNIIGSLQGEVSSLETLVTVANKQIVQLDGSFNATPHSYANMVMPEAAGDISMGGCQPLPQGQVIAISTDEDGNMFTGDMHELAKADQLGSIQFVRQDANGQFILQNSEQVQLDNGSTIQVLVQDSGTSMDQELDGNVQEENLIQSEHDPVQEFDSKETPAQQSDDLPEIVEGDMHFVVKRDDNIVYAEDTRCHVMTSTGTSPDENIETKEQNEDGQQMESQTEDFQNVEESDALTRELYLCGNCGNCSEGFASIQECKMHMIREHGFNEPHLNGKVDMGTQMEPKKKAGRKKKSEVIATVKEEPEEILMSDSDEDWSEKFTTSESSRSQRKRQPPASLRQDYYLGRSRKKSPKKRVETGLNIKCTRKGCTAKFREENTLIRHLACHIVDAGEADRHFKCEACEDRFFFWKQARYHMWKVHKIDMDLLTCNECDFRTDTYCKLKIHCEIHGAERPYTCDICGRGYKQFAQMKNHQMSHAPALKNYMSTNMADKWHTPKDCDTCGRKFANAKCLKKHKEIVHSDVKPYKCTYCSHACSRKAMLILHMRTHTGDKPFKCDQCSYCCGDHNSLRRHKMRHTGHKPYKCPHCPYACIQAISLKVHVKKRHPGMGGVFNCHMCLYRTVNKQQYENHLLDHKNGFIETVETSDGMLVQKNSAHARKDKANVNKPEITTITLQNELLQVLQSQTEQMQNTTIPGNQVVEMADVNNGTDQVTQLEVQLNEDGQNVISAEDLAKLTNYEGVAAVQLIYSALSAISQNNQPMVDINSQGVEAADVNENDIQTSIQTDSKEGVTTHTITFHLPESEELAEEVTLEQQNETQKEGMTVVEVEEGVTDWQTNTVGDQGGS